MLKDKKAAANTSSKPQLKPLKHSKTTTKINNMLDKKVLTVKTILDSHKGSLVETEMGMFQGSDGADFERDSNFNPYLIEDRNVYNQK